MISQIDDEDCFFTRLRLFPDLKVHESKVILRTYTDEPIEIVGQLNVKVQYGGQTRVLVLVVVAGDGPSLFGRVSLFDGMERWNGTMEWNGMERWNGMTTPTCALATVVDVCSCWIHR